MPDTILFVVNTAEFFLSHRLQLALAAKKRGYKVHVATADSRAIDAISRNGLSHHVVPFSRSGQNIFKEINSFFQLVRLFFRVKPALVHLVTIKPVLYGGVAARIARVKAVVSAVSGLGTVFLCASFSGRIRRYIVARLYHSAFSHERSVVIFQNKDDRNLLLALGVLSADKVREIPGSGVDLKAYNHQPEPEGRPVIVMASRLLKDKGVVEYVQAAKLLKTRGVEVRILLIGAIDPGNPTSVGNKFLDTCKAEQSVELIGYRNDIAAQYAGANIVCLPSYREGLPKSLLEAAACGRAIVTTDVPGCRDAIIPAVTGILVPAKDYVALADALQVLVENPELRSCMGYAGRQLAEEKFGIGRVVKEHLAIYQELVGKG